METVRRAKSSKFFCKGKERYTVVAGEEALPREELFKTEITVCFYADGIFQWGLLERRPVGNENEWNIVSTGLVLARSKACASDHSSGGRG